MKTETRWIVEQADRNFLYISCSVDMEFWLNTLLQGIYYFKYAIFFYKNHMQFFFLQMNIQRGKIKEFSPDYIKLTIKKANTHCYTKHNLL